jgi:octaprenyl-diphosphate synthase
LFNGGEPSSDEISRVVDLVRELGGVDYAKKKAQDFAEGASEALGSLPEGTAVDALKDSITYVVDRNR